VKRQSVEETTKVGKVFFDQERVSRGLTARGGLKIEVEQPDKNANEKLARELQERTEALTRSQASERQLRELCDAKDKEAMEIAQELQEKTSELTRVQSTIQRENSQRALSPLPLPLPLSPLPSPSTGSRSPRVCFVGSNAKDIEGQPVTEDPAPQTGCLVS